MSCFRHDFARSSCADCATGDYTPATVAEEAVVLARRLGLRAHTGEGTSSHKVVVWGANPKDRLWGQYRKFLDARVECQVFPQYRVFTFPPTTETRK